MSIINPELAETLNQVIGTLAAFPTTGVVSGYLTEWKNQLSSPEGVERGTYLDIVGGALNLIDQYQGALKFVGIAEKELVPFAAEGGLIVDLYNAYNQVSEGQLLKSDTVISIGQDITGIASTLTIAAAGTLAAPELLAIGVLAGIASIALGYANLNKTDISSIIGAIQNLPTTLSGIDEALAGAVTLGRLYSDGTIGGTLAAMQGIPANLGGVDGAMYAAQYGLPTPAASNSLTVPNSSASPYSANTLNISQTGLPTILNLGTDFSGSGGIVASVSGNDLILTGGSGKQIDVQNWQAASLTVNLPNGQSWTGAQIAQTIGTGSTTVSFEDGTTYASNQFVSQIDALGPAFSYGDSYYGAAFGVGSYTQFLWNQGLQYGYYVGQSPAGTAMYQYGTQTESNTPAFDSGTVSISDPSAVMWGNLTYDYWQDSSGNYDFAIVSASTGYGGQTMYASQDDGSMLATSVPSVISSQFSQSPTVTYTPPQSLDLYDYASGSNPSNTSIQGEFYVTNGSLQTIYNIESDGTLSQYTYQNGVLVGTLYTSDGGYSSGNVYDASGNLAYSWSDDGNGTITRSTEDSSGNWTETVQVNGYTTSEATFNTDGSYRVTSYNTDGVVTEDHIFNANSSQSNYVLSSDGSLHVWTSDGSGGSTDFESYSDGTSVSSYSNADGSYGSTTKFGNGASSIIQYANGITTDWEDDGQGDTTKTTTDSAGNRSVIQTTPMYTKATGTFSDGSSTTDILYADGSQSLVSWNADGSGYSNYSSSTSSSVTNYGPGGVVTYSDTLSGGDEVTCTYSGTVLTSKILKNSDGSSSETDWDSSGRLFEVTNQDSSGNVFVQKYENGTLIADFQLNADGTSSGHTYDSTGIVTSSWSRDSAGILTEDGVNSSGASIEWVYDASGALASQKTTSSTGISSGISNNSDGSETYWADLANGSVVTMTYDNAGNLTFGSGVNASSVHLVEEGSDLTVETGAPVNFDIPNFYTDGTGKYLLSASFSNGSQWSATSTSEAPLSFSVGIGAQQGTLSSASNNIVYADPTLNQSDISLSLDGQSNLILTLVGSPDSVTLDNWGNATAAQNTVVSFANGTSWSFNDIEGLLANGGIGPAMLEGSPSLSEFTLNGGVGLAEKSSATINFQGTDNVLLFDAGDGVDMVQNLSQNLTLSLGGGLSWNDVSLEQDGNDLVLDIGSSGKIDLQNYFQNPGANVQLQMFESSDSTGVHAELANLSSIVAAFEAAGPQTTPWSVENALTNLALTAETNQAYGGDIAAYYALNGTLGGLSTDVAQAVLKDPGFGTSQALTDPSQWQNGKYQLLAA